MIIIFPFPLIGSIQLLGCDPMINHIETKSMCKHTYTNTSHFYTFSTYAGGTNEKQIGQSNLENRFASTLPLRPLTMHSSSLLREGLGSHSDFFQMSFLFMEEMKTLSVGQTQ